MSLDDGSAPSRLRHVPSDKLAARTTTKDENFQLLRLRHVLLLFFLITPTRAQRSVAIGGLLCARSVGNATVVNISLIGGEEVPYRRCYLFCMRFERKMTSVEETNDCGSNVALKGLGAGGQEERVVLAPCRQKRRSVLAKIGLEFGIQRDAIRASMA